jgi:zinc-binding in reverse transcriptase
LNTTNISLKIKIFVWLVRRNRVLTKANFKKKGWTGNTQCMFCDGDESTDYLFVTCPYISSIWNWIATFNNFSFQGSVMEDLWEIDYSIPLKNQYVVELIRGAVLWSVWLERNRLCFHDQSKLKNVDVVGLLIINLARY